ncbi:MAG: 6-phosphogluconolactonase, partial [Bacteroidetes bacterium]|nr:6-phosphogluconolactonase [Bacteroidota bacterium]
MLNNNWNIFKNINELSQKLANDILSDAESSIKSKNSFKIVLAGGNSILQTYEILSNSKSDWGKWHIYIGDERCLPLKDKER